MKTLQMFCAFFMILLLSNTAVSANNGHGGLVESKLFSAQLLDDNRVEYVYTGTVRVFNTRDHLQIKIAPVNEFEEWEIKKVYLYVGAGPVPADPDDGFPLLDQFTYISWKWYGVYDRLIEKNIIRKEVSVSYESD